MKKFVSLASYACKGFLLWLLGMSITFAAQKEGGFIGVNYLKSSISSETTTEVLDVVIAKIEERYLGSGSSFQVGYNFKKARLYLSSSTSTFSGFTTSTSLFLADRVFESGGYLGGGIGRASMEWTAFLPDTDLLLKGGEASSGALAIKLGRILHLSDKLKLDFGFRFISTNLVTKLVTITSSSKVVVKNTGMRSFLAGIIYTF